MVEPIKELFELATPVEKMEIVAWVAEEVGCELRDEFNIPEEPENGPLVKQVQTLFRDARPIEKMEIVNWVAEQVGVEFKDGFEDE